ncbi:hypothetical protein HAALTHF_32220n [Vreelandella aquamarina]|nr:hypothetical protein HAALTHF_32220n [Halomonas axialensis]
MANPNKAKAESGIMRWVDDRFPATQMMQDHLTKYYAPKNFNFFYIFGVLALLVLVNQILTGVWLTMSFNPSAEGAFASVEYIMRDVEWGWLIRYMHTTGHPPSSWSSICICSAGCFMVPTKRHVSWCGFLVWPSIFC